MNILTEILIKKILAQDSNIATTVTLNFNFSQAAPFQVKFTTTKQIIEAASDVLFYLGGPIFILVTLIGGIIFLTAGLSVEQAKKGKDWLYWGIIGLIVVIAGRLIFELFLTLF